jgi:hypothetical protein
MQIVTCFLCSSHARLIVLRRETGPGRRRGVALDEARSVLEHGARRPRWPVAPTMTSSPAHQLRSASLARSYQSELVGVRLAVRLAEQLQCASATVYVDSQAALLALRGRPQQRSAGVARIGGALQGALGDGACWGGRERARRRASEVRSRPPEGHFGAQADGST